MMVKDYTAAYEHIRKHLDWCLHKANWNPDTMRRVLTEAEALVTERPAAIVRAAPKE